MKQPLSFFKLEPIISYKKVALGLSNNHYLINERYLMRVTKNPPRNDLNPHNEYLLETTLGTFLHPSIPTLFFDEKNNVKITPYIKGFKEFDGETATKETYIKIAALLRKIHQTYIAELANFAGIKRCELYKKEALTPKHPLEDAIINEYQLFLSKQCVPCHHDLVSGNILIFTDHVEIIDLEYGASDDPYFDLASFISENNIKDKKTIIFFLEQYFLSSPNPYQLQKLMAFLKFNDLLWYYWALMMHRAYHDEIYLQIAKEKAKHLDNPLNLL